MFDKVRLDEITTFPKLLDYLRDELDWPIEEENFDDLTFDYSPADFDLKLDGEKGRIEIKQLRPLVSTQPWGIFFLNFPGKDMPVTVLRRILGKLARKKRASQNPTERAVWDKNDLLFIASFGKTGERQLSFAHFQDRSDVGDLPALRVLGWDGQNTIRRLSYTNDILKSRLCWPDDPRDLDFWRQRWSGTFTEGKGESVATSKAMAQELARLARQIRSRANELLDAETEQGPLRQLHTAFREALIHDLKPDDFADMYAQTIAYGLLSARIARASGALTADDAALMAPATNPFLQELLKNFLQAGGRKGGMDFDELGVNEVVEMLRDANMEAVLRDFDDRNPQEDPVIHFYELFLKEYDAKKRMQRGVFYTPRPVVSFIVRSADEVLRTEFGLEDGLADTATWGEVVAKKPEIAIPEGVKPSDPFVKVLDPATGTGTFLVEVIGLVHERMVEKWRRAGKRAAEIDALWNEYVPEQLLPRLYGFELMMAPYAIAHMKVGVKLADTGYRFRSQERARIYLTNALEEPHDFDMQLAFMSEALAHEAVAANDAKSRARFTVVVGNPPYASISSNLTPSLRRIVDRYRYVDGIRIVERGMLQFEKNIQDDYIKFISFGQSTILAANCGILGYVTNHSYLDGPTLRGVRWSLLQSFDTVVVCDLHGNTNKMEAAPDGNDDQNVFDIKQGVAVCTFVRRTSGLQSRRAFHSDFWGPRSVKYSRLLQTTTRGAASTAISPSAPYYRFEQEQSSELDDEWLSWPPVNEIFRKYSTGTETGFDDLMIGFTRQELVEQISRFADPTVDVSDIKQEFGIEKGHASKLLSLRSAFRSFDESKIGRFQIRAYDYRSALLWKRFLKTNSFSSFENVDTSHPAIVVTRQTKEGFTAFTVGSFSGHKLTSGYDRSYILPVFLKEKIGRREGWRTNLQPSFEAALRKLYTAISSPLDEGFGNAILAYLVAILNSPTYRSTFGPKLKRDWPRVPLPRVQSLLKELISVGNRLVALHLLDPELTPDLKAPATIRLAGSGDAEIPSTGGKNGYPRFVNGRVYVNPDRWFEEVPLTTWEFHVGGYQVCEKWLKDRRGRTLSADDILHYRRIVHALTETRKIMAEIDAVIEAHGGWPDAFRGMAD